MLEKKEIKHIASLARIGVSEKEIEKYRKDLSSVLDYFEKLEKVDTSKVEPIGHISGVENITRIDRDEDFGNLGKDAIFKNVPEKKNGHIKVKSVL